MTKMKPPPFLIDEILLSGTATALVSKPGIGKTFLAMDMAFCLAAGVPWHGFKTLRTPVVYILAEGQGGTWQRVCAWRQEHQIDPNAEVGVHFWNQPVQLPHFPARVEFLNELQKVKPNPALIVVDTLARCFGGRDENAAGDMNEFVAGVDALRSTGAAVLILHHEGHTPGRERGSSALRGAIDALMILEEGVNRGDLVLRSIKQKEGELFDPLPLVRRQVELPPSEAAPDGATSCVIEDAPLSTLPMPAPWMEAAKLLPSEPPGLTFNEYWRVVDGENLMSRATFKRMLKWTKARGVIVYEGERYRRGKEPA